MILRTWPNIGKVSLVSFLVLFAWNANAAVYNYDEAGRLVAATQDDGSQILFEYDDAGNRTEVQRAALGAAQPVDAVNDTVAINEGDTPTVISVLSNDMDDAPGTLVFDVITQPENGSVQANGNGTITYTEDFQGTGPHDFTYTLLDADGYYDAAMVTINYTDIVNAVDDTPTAANEDTNQVISVLANDGDPGGDSIVHYSQTQPTHGTITVNQDDTITYNPDTNYYGSDSFTYTIEEASDPGVRDTATVTVTVINTPESPVAVNDSVTDYTGEPLIIGVLANDYDPDGDPITITSVQGGTVVNNGTAVRFITTSWGDGTFRKTYWIQDSTGRTDSARITLHLYNGGGGTPY